MTEIKPLKDIAAVCADYAKTAGKKAIVEALPVNADASATPLVMDAKATLAKISIGGVNKAKFEELKSSVFREINEYVNEMQRSLRRKINPVTDSNFEDIKSRLQPFAEYIKPSLREDLFNAKSPTTFFIHAKYNAEQLITQDYALDEIVRKSKILGETPELERDLQRCENDEITRGIFKVFTPKSTIPEVIKIEDELRQVGITDVNLSDDLKQAQYLREAVKKMANNNIPLPKEIMVSPIMPFDKGGLTITDIQNNSRIYLPTSVEDELMFDLTSDIENVVRNLKAFKNASLENQGVLIREMRQEAGRHSPVTTPIQKIYHEFGHIFGKTSKQLSEEELDIAREISEYASSQDDGKEIVPEMFVVLMSGKHLTDRQMALYTKLGGIVPRL